LSFRIWQRKLLHKCFNITSKTQLCSNFRCQVLKEKSVSPDERVPPGESGGGSPQVSLSLTHTHTHTLTHSHTLSLTLSLSLSHTHTLTLTPPGGKRMRSTTRECKSTQFKPGIVHMCRFFRWFGLTSQNFGEVLDVIGTNPYNPTCK
jgi:hypothetical protein